MYTKQNENIIQNIEKKVDAMKTSSCLLSVNMQALSLSVDVCWSTQQHEALLERWQSCLPLGESGDVNFSASVSTLWRSINDVRGVYKLDGMKLSQIDYRKECYVRFKDKLLLMGEQDATLRLLQEVDDGDVAEILVCALRELAEVLRKITKFLNSPTEELIATSFERWQSEYHQHYMSRCMQKYSNWKIRFSRRTVNKKLIERRKEELENFKSLFVNDDEFDQVFDIEQQTIDIDGLSRFLFTHPNRFGLSRMGTQTMLSSELVRVFDFIEIWRQTQSDLQPEKKHAEKAAAEDVLPGKVIDVIQKVSHLVVDKWVGVIERLWRGIIQTFHHEIASPGPHEKFKDFSKKTVYCIVGHLKLRGVYRNDVANAEVARLLEDGKNTGMRKYVNNGLDELPPLLKQKMTDYIALSMQQVTV